MINHELLEMAKRRLAVCIEEYERRNKENASLRKDVECLAKVVDRYIDYLKLELRAIGPPPEGHICGPEGNCDADCEIRYYLQRDLEQARAALAKARGE